MRILKTLFTLFTLFGSNLINAAPISLSNEHSNKLLSLTTQSTHLGDNPLPNDCCGRRQQQDPTLAAGHPWDSNAFTCEGKFFSKLADPNYNGTPPTPPSDMVVATDPVSQVWYTVFGDSIQMTNSTGGWTYLSGMWWNIANMTYEKQASFEGESWDVSTNECMHSSHGLVFDITSCGCRLSSQVTVYNNTLGRCDEGPVPNRDHTEGVALTRWDFGQFFQIPGGPRILSGGVFVVNKNGCELAIRNVPEVPAGPHPDFCSFFGPTDCT